MIASMGLRTLCVAPLPVLVLTGRVQMWEVYAIAIAFGILDAFFMPARQSILPSVVADHELEPGNAVINATSQASVMLGPVVAGATIAAFGTGWAFAGDAAYGWLGIGIGVVGLLPALLPAALVMGLAGIATGAVNTYGISWLQRRIDPAMQGQVMSLVMLGSMGLAPISYAASGALADVSPTLLFAVGGAMILFCAVGAAANRSVRSLR